MFRTCFTVLKRARRNIGSSDREGEDGRTRWREKTRRRASGTSRRRGERERRCRAGQLGLLVEAGEQHVERLSAPETKTNEEASRKQRRSTKSRFSSSRDTFCHFPVRPPTFTLSLLLLLLLTPLSGLV
ncbi:hypothetical protein L596_005686 [Steinernema carpocapsae]|uniref:Uncharacterized protein n=1 Tax=Steinernema carpocapsae TaxID=34508 RepID=A0A4U8UZY3_STECR|nr:hypothetical protein L596_005686 [Steinernema carpocapsae]